MERAQGLLAAYQSADADQPAAVRRRAHCAPALRGRTQQQANSRYAAGLFPGVPRPSYHRAGHGSGIRQPPGRDRSLARRTRRHLIAMAFTLRTRLVNPRLGTYFGIFTAAYASLVLMALMFEQLGTADL